MDKNAEVRLSEQEIGRLGILRRIQRGELTQVAGATHLDVCERHVRRLMRRLKREGVKALVHGNRGRSSNRRLKETVKVQIQKLYEEKYAGFNLTHFREMLGDREKIAAPSREVIRQVLLQGGLWERSRKAAKHRLRRARREREGELLQIDASIHPWLGEDKPDIALVGGIDDATSEVTWALFAPAETTEAYFEWLQEILIRRGVPGALYGDRDSIFQVNNARDLENLKAQGRKPETQFGRALRELGIEWIAAQSPQAKGRIERLWGTLQDRLLHELRIENVQTLPEANKYLQQRFLPSFNRKFRVRAAREERAYRPAPCALRRDAALCWKETRVLARDHTFSFEAKVWQVLPCSVAPALNGRRVEVRRTLRGSTQAWLGDHKLTLRPAPAKLQRAPLRAPHGALATLAATSRENYRSRGTVLMR